MSALLLLAATATPPEMFWTACPAGRLVDVECAGFVDGDSTEDVFAASSESTGQGIICFSGATGSQIWLNNLVPGAAGAGCLRAIRDVDGDGVFDVAAGTSGTPAISVLSGSTGEVIWSIPLDHPVCWVESANGPGPADVYVLANRLDTYWTSCRALLGQTGAEQWDTPWVATTDHWMEATEADVNGTGWSEFGISVDRGSVSSGWADVLDGLNGGLIHREGTMYFGTMDICDTPMPLMALSHFGTSVCAWAYSINSGSVVWKTGDPQPTGRIVILPNITEPSAPEREVLFYGGTHISVAILEECYAGAYMEYTFPSSVAAVDYYSDSPTWSAAVVTSGTFYCPSLDFWSSPPVPSVALPGTGAEDICLLQSEYSPTPLVAVAMNGEGPGICAIRTSWPEGVEGQVPCSSLVLGSCRPSPGSGVFVVEWSSGEGLTRVSVHDASGRLRLDRDLGQMAAGEHSCQPDLQGLPSGCYLVVVSCGSERASTKLVLLR